METAETASNAETAVTAICTCASQPFMSVAVGAQKIGRSAEYLYAGLREGRFPGVKFGRKWVLYTDFVQGFLTEVVGRRLSISFEDYAANWLARALEGEARQAAEEVA